MEGIITAVLTPIITALVVWAIERDRTKKDELREKAEKINSEINVATMELAYATAMAVKRGKANGEVETAVAAYKEAKKHREEFLETLKNKML